MTLRPSTAEDEAFLRRVYATSRAEELAPLPWSEEQKAAFLEMQYNAQDSHYRAHFEDAQFLVVEFGGEAIGRLNCWRNADELRVIDIALLPEWRNRGFGTRLLADILDEAAADGLCVSLHVESSNIARRLYERLGFVVVEPGPVHDRLEWRPSV